MYLISGNKSECTGCSACADCCPNNCIIMKPDVYGFLYPEIDHSRCIDCKLCEKSCPDFQINSLGNQIDKCLYGYNIDDNITDKSSSGGVFYELAKNVLDKGGIVFGAAWADGFQLRHTVATTLEDLPSLLGSKYVQSNCLGTYKMVKQYLANHKMVLFSGTPCQVAGLKSFLGKDYDDLILVDILCHGVPSQVLFDRWISEQTNKKGRIVYLKFRDKKKYGWQHCLTYKSETNGRVKRYDEMPAFNSYYYLFIKGYTLRESCYQCRYTCQQRVGDISIGDYWSAAKNKKISYKVLRNGVSIVFSNSAKGDRAIKSLKNTCFFECNLQEVVDSNRPLKSSMSKPGNYDEVLSLGSVNEMYLHVVSRKDLIKDRVKAFLPRKLYYYLSGLISNN